MFEICLGEGLLDRLAGQQLVLGDQVGSHAPDPRVQGMVDRGEIGSDPLDPLVDQKVDDLGLRAGMTIEVGDVVARWLGPAVSVPARVEHDDIALPDLLALRDAALDVCEAIEGPWPGDGPQVDHKARPVELIEPDAT